MSQINLCNFSFTSCWGGRSLHAAAVGEASRGSKAPESAVIVVLDYIGRYILTRIYIYQNCKKSQKYFPENSSCKKIYYIYAMPWYKCSHPDIGLDTLRSESPGYSDMFPRGQSCSQLPSIWPHYSQIYLVKKVTLPFSPDNSLHFWQGSSSSLKWKGKLQQLMHS